jgi:isopentenyldiphosphate isomerase
MELLEVWDWETGLPTGESVARDVAHRDGIPHEAVHLWILRDVHMQPEMLFQFRAPHKENYPNCLDITVGGHVPYGFSGNKIAKEAREEVGITPDEKNLTDLGWYRYEERTGPLFQRELQHVYILRDDRDLFQYRFSDGEVTGIFAVGLGDLKTILAGDSAIEVLGFNGREPVRKKIGRADFHPQLFHISMAPYMRVIIGAAEELAAGAPVTVKMPEL